MNGRESDLMLRRRTLCFPSDDDIFATYVQTCLDGSNGEGPFPAAIQALLRETYPLAVIAPRHDLAALDGAQVWYAFRDGSMVAPVDTDSS
jgi:hypothetical protein